MIRKKVGILLKIIKGGLIEHDPNTLSFMLGKLSLKQILSLTILKSKITKQKKWNY